MTQEKHQGQGIEVCVKGLSGIVLCFLKNCVNEAYF